MRDKSIRNKIIKIGGFGMKKFLVLVLAVVFCFCLVGCNNNNNEEGQENPENQGDSPTPPPIFVPDNNPEENENPEEEDLTASEELSSLVAELNQSANVEINAPFDSKLATYSYDSYGLTKETYDANVVDSIMNESMMSPSDHSLCIVKVNSDADKATLTNQMFENCNPRKWVCMSAKYVLAAYTDDYVMLVMSTEEKCNNLYKAFQDKFGADKVSEALTKSISE